MDTNFIRRTTLFKPSSLRMGLAHFWCTIIQKEEYSGLLMRLCKFSTISDPLCYPRHPQGRPLVFLMARIRISGVQKKFP